MSRLVFAGTREHALLALVIREAQSVASVGYLGRTALQKIVYFLKALGVPTRYQFEIHRYGPYCDQITSDIDLLLADGIVLDRSSAAKYWNYALTAPDAGEELFQAHQVFVNAYMDLVRKVVAVFGPLEPRDLEVYATLHYAYRYELAGAEAPSKKQVIARFRDYKGMKFTDAQLNAAFDAMVAAKLIHAPSQSDES
jgi:hypothetical protein